MKEETDQSSENPEKNLCQKHIIDPDVQKFSLHNIKKKKKLYRKVNKENTILSVTVR